MVAADNVTKIARCMPCTSAGTMMGADQDEVESDEERGGAGDGADVGNDANQAARSPRYPKKRGKTVENQHANAPGSTLVVDNIVTMVWAGHDTTAAALSFTARLMAEHQDVQAKLATELKVLAAKNGGSEATADSLTG